MTTTNETSMVLAADPLTSQAQYQNRLICENNLTFKLDRILARLRELTSDVSAITTGRTKVQLHDCLIRLTSDGQHLAISHGIHLFILAASNSSNQATAGKRSKTKSTSSSWMDEFGLVDLSLLDENENERLPVGALTRKETVTSICWIQTTPDSSNTALASPSTPSSPATESILFVGFSNGLIRAYRTNGQLLFTQRLQSGAVKQLRVRRCRSTRLVSSTAPPTTELLVLYPQALAWVDGRSLATSLRDSIQACQAIINGSSYSQAVNGADLLASSATYPWSFRAWSHATQVIEDVLPCEQPLTSFGDIDFLTSTASPMHMTTPCFVAAGTEPALAFYTPQEEEQAGASSGSRTGASHSHSTRGTIKLVASKLTSAVFTMAKTWWHSDTPTGADEATESLPDPDDIELERCIRDGSRQILTLSGDPLSSSGDDQLLAAQGASYAVASDNYGRVMLLDLQSFLMIRMWKGYRDAQCCLVRQQYLENGTTSVTTSSITPLANSTSPSTASATKSSSKSLLPKKAKGKLSVVQHSVDDESDDPFKDFDSAPTPTAAATSSTKLPSSSSPATLSTRVPSASRPTAPPLHMLLYAPRRGQLELWSLPYGARVGARNVGIGCVLLHGSWSPNTNEVSAQLVRADGTIQTLLISAPTPPISLAPPVEPSPMDAEAAADLALMNQVESNLLSWARSHQCRGFECGESSDTFAPFTAPLTELAARLRSRRPKAESEWKEEEALLPDEQVARLVQLIQGAAERLWTSFLGGATVSPSSPTLCPRLCESLLQSVLQLLTTAIQLASPSITITTTEIQVDDVDHETTITISQPSGPIAEEAAKHDAAAAGWKVRATSKNLLLAEQLKQTVSGWLHLLAVYHTSCAPAGQKQMSSFSNHGMTLLQFLDCFHVHVDETKAVPQVAPPSATPPDAAVSSTTAKSKVAPKKLLVKEIEPVAASTPPAFSTLLRFTLNDHLMKSLLNSTQPSATLTSLSLLLFGPTSVNQFKRSDFIACKCLDLLLHLDSAGFDRRLLFMLFCQTWWIHLDVTMLQELLRQQALVTTGLEWKLSFEQLQILFQSFIQPPHGSITNQLPTLSKLSPLAPISAFLSTTISWCFHSYHLDHISILLRFIRTFVVLPQKAAYINAERLHEEKRIDSEFVSGDAQLHQEVGLKLTKGVTFLNLLDVSSRILFRHLCQLQFLRQNFPSSAVADQVLSLNQFVQSYPLSRLVAMHLLKSNMDDQGHNGLILAKEEIEAKLHSFESILASGDFTSVESTNQDQQILVASLLAVRALPTDPYYTTTRTQTVPVPIPSWDWKFESDEPSCFIYAAIHAIQHFMTSISATSTPGNTHDLLCAISYLEYAPVSALSGGLACFLWTEILSPHLRALVHAAYPDLPPPESKSPTPPPPTSSASSLASMNLAAAKAKIKAIPATFLKLLKSLYTSTASSPAPYLIDFSDLESLRTLFTVSQRTLAYLNSCFIQEEKDLAWEASPTYFCPAIAQTLDQKIQYTIPIRQADQAGKKKLLSPQANSKQPVTSNVSDSSSAFDRFTSALTHPSDGPPPTATTPSVCTSLFHTHVRYTHPESNVTYANLPSPLYSQLTNLYQDTDLDRTMSDLMRVVEVLSAHVELDLSTSLLASLNCTIGHMFPTHPFVQDAQAFKCLTPKQPSIFPRLHHIPEKKVDVSEWITKGLRWIDVPATPKPLAPTAASSKNAPPPPALVPLSPIPLMAARLSFLMNVLKERSALSTAPMVFSLSEVLCLPPAYSEALLREHILLLYERGEDTRAWECVPRLDDGVCIASVLIGIGRTRLGLFLHALESKNAAKYAQLVSGVPAQAWQWLSKAKPPHTMTKAIMSDDQSTASNSSSSTSASTTTTLTSSTYILSGTPTATASSTAYDPLQLILTRPVNLKQKSTDIDIHATLTLIKRAKAIFEQAFMASISPIPSPSSTTTVTPISGESFGKDGDNQDSYRLTQPLRYGRAYVTQLVDIAGMVVRGIGRA